MPTHLPPHLSDLLHRLSESGRLFIEQYDRKKERMQVIAQELWGISNEVKEMQKSANTTRMMGAVFGGLGLAVGIAAALLTGSGKIAILGGTAAISGGAAVVTANVTKAATENTSIKTVEELGKEFMEIVEIQKDALQKIKEVSEELEKKSSSLMTKTRSQTKRSQLEQALKQAAELSERSREVMHVTLAMLKRVRELLDLICNVTRILPTAGEDAEFRSCITDSAVQCEKTVHEFAKMRNMLQDFEEME